MTVLGTPAPQGSKRHVGHGILVESSAKVAPWRQAVVWAVLAEHWVPVEGPVRIEVVFTVAKPKSAPKRTTTWPAKRPDLDKLVRSTLDALTDSGAIRDDAQIVDLVAAKRYPGEGERSLATPGVWLRLTELDR